MRFCLFPKAPYGVEISLIDRRLKAIDREIRYLEKELHRARKFSPLPKMDRGRGVSAKEDDSEARKRFASYLSTGSFQTIREYKFKSDLIRKRRLIWVVVILAVIALAAFLLYRFK